MHEELKEEDIVRAVGGRFRLSALIQKRIAALNKGAQPLVEVRTNDKMAIVIQEIMEGKIKLDANSESRTLEALQAQIQGSKLSDLDFSDD